MPETEAIADWVSEHRPFIHRHCYRMTGSVHDADDLTQETFVRAWTSIETFRGDAAVRTWLYRIATNLCLSFLRTARTRRLPSPGIEARYQTGQALPAPDLDAAWLEPYPTPEQGAVEREALSLAFVTTIQTLSPRARAVFLLVELLGFSAAEVAPIVGSTTAAVNSVLQRSRHSIRRAEPAQRVPTGPESAIVARYLAAWDAGDPAAFLALLRADATMVMPPYPVWVSGRTDIVRVLADYPLRGLRWKLVPTVDANGRPALGFYAWRGDRWEGWGLQVIEVEAAGDAALVSGIFVFKTPHLLPAFGLPSEISIP